MHFFLFATNTAAPLRRSSSWTFDEKMLVQALYKVLHKVSKKSPIVLYIRDVEKFLQKSPKMYLLFEKLLTKLEGPVLLLGSRIVDMDFDDDELDDRLSALFPYNIDIKPPENENCLVSWNSQLEEDMKIIQFQDNRNHITEVLAENDRSRDAARCGGLGTGGGARPVVHDAICLLQSGRGPPLPSSQNWIVASCGGVSVLCVCVDGF